MSDSSNVVFLAHRNDTPTDVEERLSCKNCQNKTYIAVWRDGIDSFPQLQCASCGSTAGKFGWVNEDEGPTK